MGKKRQVLTESEHKLESLKGTHEMFQFYLRKTKKKEEDFWKRLRYDDENGHLDPIWKKLPRRCQVMLRPKYPLPPKVPEPERIIEAEECFVTCPRIIPREDWLASPPKSPPNQMMYRVRPAIHLETDTSGRCETENVCKKTVKYLQQFNMDILNFSDIAHSFLIGEDGQIYEGRGWGCENENSTGFLAIGYIGFYTAEPYFAPTEEMLLATYNLIMCGVRKGFLFNPFLNGKFKGDTPLELMNELIEIKEEVDFRVSPEEVVDFEYEFAQHKNPIKDFFWRISRNWFKVVDDS